MVARRLGRRRDHGALAAPIRYAPPIAPVGRQPHVAARWALLLAAQLAACSARCGHGGAATTAPVIVLRSQLVDSGSGRVLGPIPSAPGVELYNDRNAMPEAGEPGAYGLGPFVVSTAPRYTRLRAGPRIDEKLDALVYDEANGARRWSLPLGGAARRQTWDEVVSAGDAVTFALFSELRVLDASSGALRWTAPGLHEAPVGVGTLLATIDRSPPAVVARRLADGVEAFRRPLGDGHWTFLAERQGHLMIAHGARRAGAELVDVSGRVVLEVREPVADVRLVDGQWLVAGQLRLSSIAPGGEVRWALPPVLDRSAESAAFLAVTAEDWVVIQWSGGGDSGVGVARVSSGGAERWRHVAEPLGVTHSEYYHDAYALLDGRTLLVTSQASGGSFLERIDVETGALLARWRYEPDHGW